MGHGLSSMLFGGSSSAATEAPAAAPQSSFESERRSGGSCEIQSKGELLCSCLQRRCAERAVRMLENSSGEERLEWERSANGVFTFDGQTSLNASMPPRTT